MVVLRVTCWGAKPTKAVEASGMQTIIQPGVARIAPCCGNEWPQRQAQAQAQQSGSRLVPQRTSGESSTAAIPWRCPRMISFSSASLKV